MYMSPRSKKLLTEHIGGDLTLLGEIPDDPAMERAVRGYLPVVDREPATPAAVALAAIADTLLTRIASPAG
jgi:flagellar biosynthesis protein FlhG